jgi:hypothetical protein
MPRQLEGHPRRLGERVEQDRDYRHGGDGDDTEEGPGDIRPREHHPSHEQHDEGAEGNRCVDDERTDPVTLFTLEVETAPRAVFVQCEVGIEGVSTTPGTAASEGSTEHG